MKKAVLISCFDTHEKRLRLICELLQKEYDVTILLSDFDHIAKKRNGNSKLKCEYIHVMPYKKNISVKRLYSHDEFARKTYHKLQTIMPDLIYAVIPPNSIAKYCAKYKLMYKKVKLIFDIMDMWPESVPLERLKRTWPFRIWKDYRDQNLRFADFVFTECELYQFYLKKYLPPKYGVLYLAKDHVIDYEDIAFRKRKNQRNSDEIILGYLGSINHIIDIGGIEKLISELGKHFRITVKIIGDGESRELFIDTLKRAGANVLFYGVIFDDKKKFEILKECDYALNMMIDSVKVGLTIKSIDYFSYGLPLINNIKGDTWKLINERGIGINFDGDVNALLKKIECSDNEIYERIYEIFQKQFTIEAFQNSVKKGLDSVQG